MSGTALRAPISTKQGASNALCAIPQKEHLRDKSSKKLHYMYVYVG